MSGFPDRNERVSNPDDRNLADPETVAQSTAEMRPPANLDTLNIRDFSNKDRSELSLSMQDVRDVWRKLLDHQNPNIIQLALSEIQRLEAFETPPPAKADLVRRLNAIPEEERAGIEARLLLAAISARK